MSEHTDFLLLVAFLFVPFAIVAVYLEYQVRKRTDERGECIDEARAEGPSDAIQGALAQKQRQHQATERNILTLSEREIFALLGMSYHTKLSLGGIEHKMGEPVIEVWIEERLVRHGPPPIGYHEIHAQHNFEIEITELDDLLDEPTIMVKDDVSGLRALGISAREAREYEDAFGDTVHVEYEREWVDAPHSRYGYEYTISKTEQVEPNMDDVIWDSSSPDPYSEI